VPRNKYIVLAALMISIISAAIVAAGEPGSAPEQTESRPRFPPPRLHDARLASTDLEVGGELAGVPPGMTRYITREDLLALPQVEYTVTDDTNFTVPTKVSGIPLEDLMLYLRAVPTADMVIAISDDEYRAHYTRNYLDKHHPFLVLEVNGKPPSGWPKDSDSHQNDMGPYMVSHPNFTPSFDGPSHVDEPLVPWGVVRIEFQDENTVFAGIAPRGPHANDPGAQEGYRIARQNCFRCHNAGAEGGQKAKVGWIVLTTLAAHSPDFFASYVRNPKARNPKAQMPGNPDYDEATIAALVTYFETLSERAKP
jgi:mono/diheme cytochrome c family protein